MQGQQAQTPAGNQHHVFRAQITQPIGQRPHQLLADCGEEGFQLVGQCVLGRRIGPVQLGGQVAAGHLVVFACDEQSRQIVLPKGICLDGDCLEVAGSRRRADDQGPAPLGGGHQVDRRGHFGRRGDLRGPDGGQKTLVAGEPADPGDRLLEFFLGGLGMAVEGRQPVTLAFLLLLVGRALQLGRLELP